MVTETDPNGIQLSQGFAAKTKDLVTRLLPESATTAAESGSSRYTGGMRVIAGKVKGGVVVLDDAERLVEGATVRIVINAGETPFDAPPEGEAALLAAPAPRTRR